MGNFSTLIYLYSNFDDFDRELVNVSENIPIEFDLLLKDLDKNVIKIPDRIVQNVLDFAQNYS